MSNDGNLSQLLIDINKRINGAHLGQPVNLNVKAFKRYLKQEYPELKGSEYNYVVKQYKTEAWSDYDDIVKLKLAEPSHPVVNKRKSNGKQSEQATDLPLASE